MSAPAIRFVVVDRESPMWITNAWPRTRLMNPTAHASPNPEVPASPCSRYRASYTYIRRSVITWDTSAGDSSGRPGGPGETATPPTATSVTGPSDVAVDLPPLSC